MVPLRKPMKRRRADGGLRLGLFTSTVFPMSGSSMEALAVSQCSCEESEPPPARQADTARAWLAAAACSGYSFFTWLPVVCAAVLYAGYMDQFPHVPRRDASWPFTIMLVIINVGGVCYAVSLQWLSERFLLIVAAILCTGSLFMSSFTHDILELVVLLGICYGMGVASTSIVPTVLMVHHFDKYRATALALISGSVDVSGMLTPSLVQLFIDKYAFSGCLLLLGGLSLNLFIACIFLKRPEGHRPANEAVCDEQQTAIESSGMEGSQTTVIPEAVTSLKSSLTGRGDHSPHEEGSGNAVKLQHSRGDVRTWLKSTVSLAMVHARPSKSSPGDNARDAEMPGMHLPDKVNMMKQPSSLDLYTRFTETSESGHFDSPRHKFGEAVVQLEKIAKSQEAEDSGDAAQPEASVVGEPPTRTAATKASGFLQKLWAVSTAYTWMVCLSKGAANFSSYTFSLVIVDYAHDSGVLGQKAALLSALFSLGCLIATLLTGPAVDRAWISKYAAMMLSCVVQAGALVASSAWRSFAVLAVCSFLAGVGRGVRCFLFPVLISERCSLDDLPAALSLMNAACSIALFLRTPLIGFVRDSSGSYATLLLGLAAVNVFQLIVWLIYNTVTRFRSR